MYTYLIMLIKRFQPAVILEAFLAHLISNQTSLNFTRVPDCGGIKWNKKTVHAAYKYNLKLEIKFISLNENVNDTLRL